MLISQHPCSKGVRVRWCPRGLPKGKTDRRQTKSNKENRYVIKVIRFKQGRGYGS